MRALLLSLLLLLLPGAPAGAVWPAPPVESQGARPACVGYAFHALLLAEGWAAPPASLAIYGYARQWDGLNDVTTTGTTIPGALAWLEAAGWVARAESTRDPAVARAWLLAGPVLVEADWRAGMSWPDADGAVHVAGPVGAHHAWLAYGVDAAGAMLAQNSWGAGWGPDGGRFRVVAGDWPALLATGRVWRITRGPGAAARYGRGKAT
jgi:hypothetical protein